ISPATAIAYGGMPILAQICPRTDTDWYSITVPAGSNLLDVSAAYPTTAVTKVALAVQVYAQDGKTPIPKAGLTDGNPNDGKSSLKSTFKVPMPGTYLISVRDAKDGASDSNNSYVLTLGTAADPDTHEPNDTAMQAKATDSNPGFIAYQGDLDYFSLTVP